MTVTAFSSTPISVEVPATRSIKILSAGILLFISSFHILPAQPIISEIMHNPTGNANSIPGDDSDEWIELFNPLAASVDLTGYKISDGDALDAIIPWDTLVHGFLQDPDAITNSAVLPAGAFAVILDPEYTALSNTQIYDFPQGTIILTVQNSTLGDGLTEGDPLILFQKGGAISANIVSSYGTPKMGSDSLSVTDDSLDLIPLKEPPAGEGKSVERISLSAPDQENNWAYSTSTFGATPGRPPVFSTIPKIRFNEIVTAPLLDWSSVQYSVPPGNSEITDTDEWIELLNQDTLTVNLAGWYLKMQDSSPETDFFSLSTDKLFFSSGSDLTHFQPGQILILGNPSGALNNDVTLLLYNNGNLLVDSVTVAYHKICGLSVPEFESFAKSSQNVWKIKNATPGLSNPDDQNVLDNAAPLFTLTTVQETLYIGDTLHLVLQACDPEGSKLTYQIESPPPNSFFFGQDFYFFPTHLQIQDSLPVTFYTQDSLQAQDSLTVYLTIISHEFYYKMIPEQLLTVTIQETLQVSLKVTNAGSAVPSVAVLRIYLDSDYDQEINPLQDQLIDSVQIPPIPSGDTLTLIWKWNSPSRPSSLLWVLNSESDVTQTVLKLDLIQNSNDLGLRINEIMSNPLAGQAEWLEIVNTRSAPFYFEKLLVQDHAGIKSVSMNQMIQPFAYFIITDNLTKFKDQFPLIPNQVFETPLNLNLTDTLNLYDPYGIHLDSALYMENWGGKHWKQGISLERITLDLPATQSSNWWGSLDPLGATPGKMNSLSENLSKTIQLDFYPNPFSPDADGFEDETQITFKIPIQSDVALKIFDVRGKLQKVLLKGSQVSRSLTWDGRDDQGRRLKIGIYIALLKGSSPSGIFQKKKTIVIARPMN